MVLFNLQFYLLSVTPFLKCFLKCSVEHRQELLALPVVSYLCNIILCLIRCPGWIINLYFHMSVSHFRSSFLIYNFDHRQELFALPVVSNR